MIIIFFFHFEKNRENIYKELSVYLKRYVEFRGLNENFNICKSVESIVMIASKKQTVEKNSCMWLVSVHSNI
jgi:hypothetical protein